jgi:uncharacterized NAD(P)/FAD-binding protein YdhS
VQADPLGLGLHVDETCTALNARGAATPGLHALGPLTQGRFFEITAFAEIREQAERLAALIQVDVVMRELSGARLASPANDFQRMSPAPFGEARPAQA